MQTFYPMFCSQLHSNAEFYWAAPISETPQGTIHMLVRDPVDRFLSACSLQGLDIATALAGLPSQDMHFAPQSASSAGAALYKYPDQIEAFCAATGLTLTVNNATQNALTATDDQKSAIKNFYAADVALFEGL